MSSVGVAAKGAAKKRTGARVVADPSRDTAEDPHQREGEQQEDPTDHGTQNNCASNTDPHYQHGPYIPPAEHVEEPESSQNEVVDERANGFTIFIPNWLMVVMIFVCSVALLFCTFFVYLELRKPRFSVPPEIMQDLGLDGVIMFRQHDRDSDGVLDLVEFEPLAHRLLEINITHHYELSTNESDELLTLKAYFTPTVLSSMTKDFDTRPPGLDQLHGLKRWRAVSKTTRHVAARHFGAWMPPADLGTDTVGEVYELIEVPEELGQGVPISSNRYVPPRLVGQADILIHELLTMFHPRPFVMSRFMPHGSVAVVRAVNSRTVEIVFRIHAEFQLNEAPFNPFWYSPAQFTGHLTIDKDLKHIHDFTIYVPNDKKLNVDMEWLTGLNSDQGMEVDIGFMPEMVINCTGPSGVKREGTNASDLTPDTQHADSIQWTEEISMAEALHKLGVKMYPFKKITYHNMTEAFDLAQQQDKLVHHVLLWGALDDQSC